MAIKNEFRGIFNFSRVIEVHYAYAYSPEQAKLIMMKRMARKHDVPFGYVYGMFAGEKDNFEINLEMEFKEKEESL